MKQIIILILQFICVFSATRSFLKKNQLMKLKHPYRPYHYEIESIETNITIPKNSVDGLVREKVDFEFSEGIYDNITRKINFTSMNKIFHPRANSKKLAIKETRVEACLDNNQSICLTTFFDSKVVAGKLKNVTIYYEYVMEDLVRSKQNNSIHGLYYGKKEHEVMGNQSIIINFEQELPFSKLKTTPIPTKEKLITTNDTQLVKTLVWEGKLEALSLEIVHPNFSFNKKLSIRYLWSNF